MTASLLLHNGSQTLELNAAPYRIGKKFSLPALSPENQFATGSSANIYGGGSLVATRYKNRVWEFEVLAEGTTIAEVQEAVRRVLVFPCVNGLIEYRIDSSVPAPLWGQFGAPLTFEIVAADIKVWSDYALFADRQAVITVSLTIKPLALGLAQRACTATGGIQEDVIGAADGRSRGTIIPEAVVLNRMTNPVFGAGTWNTGWTAGALLTAAQNLDERWLIPGTISSAHLTSISASFGELFSQSINAGNTNKHSLSCLARRPDGAAVTTSDAALYYGADLTATTYTHLGNGWYWLRMENFDGVNAGTDTGLNLRLKREIYVTAFQLEEKAYCTPAAWGDLLGCAWTGTAHASTSTRTAASCKILNDSAAPIIKQVQGSVRCVVQFHVPNTYPDFMQLWDSRDGSNTSALRLVFDFNTDIFSLKFAAVSIDSAPVTFASGTTYVLHATWNAAGAALYVNGALANSASYGPNGGGAALLIGMNYSVDKHVKGVIKGLATFDQALSATEVLADYNDLAPLVAAGQRVDAIPWLWTLSGDNVLSLDTGKQPLGVVGGVPGTLPALSDLRITSSANFTTIAGILLSTFAASGYIPPGNLLIDSSGAAAAGDYGGQHRNTTIDTTVAQISTSAGTINDFVAKELHGREVSYWLRLKAASATVINLYAAFLTGPIRYSSVRRITPATTYRFFSTNPLILDLYDTKFSGLSSSAIIGGAYAAVDASTLSVDVDYTAIVPRPALVLLPTGTTTTLALRGWEARYTASGAIYGPIDTVGDSLEFVPNKYNHLLGYVGAGETVDPLTTYALTIAALYLTPRFALL